MRADCSLITKENINGLLLKSGFDRDLGLLSIDVDGVDYWLLGALSAYRPRILVVEYNAIFGAERLISVPYDPAFVRRRKHYSDLYFGASLAAFAHQANLMGYSLVGTGTAGVNAFFVRNDVLGSRPGLSVADGFTETRIRQSRNRAGHLDYLSLEESRAAIRGLPVVNVETGAMELF